MVRWKINQYFSYMLHLHLPPHAKEDDRFLVYINQILKRRNIGPMISYIY